MDQARKRSIKRFLSLGCVIAVAILIFTVPLLSKNKADNSNASILSGTVSTGSIQNTLIGGGTLSEDDAVTISVPAAVKLKEFLVSNGDHVAEGDPIASVDRVTVMKAITQVQQTLDYLSGQIEDANDTSTTEKPAAAIRPGTGSSTVLPRRSSFFRTTAPPAATAKMEPMTIRYAILPFSLPFLKMKGRISDGAAAASTTIRLRSVQKLRSRIYFRSDATHSSKSLESLLPMHS